LMRPAGSSDAGVSCAGALCEPGEGGRGPCGHRLVVRSAHRSIVDFEVGDPRSRTARSTKISGTRGNYRRGSANRQARLTEADVVEVRALYRRGLDVSEIAARFQVSRSAIQLLLAGKTWGHVPDPDGPVVMRRGRPARLLCLSPEQVVELRTLYRQGSAMEEIAARLKVSAAAVRCVLIGQTWRHLPDPDGPIVIRKPGASGEDHHSAKLTVVDVRAIRRAYTAGEGEMALARRFGVSPATIYQIVQGKTWRGVT
jgi:predicted DNA-binding protein YlxM (UPF0122 family)